MKKTHVGQGCLFEQDFLRRTLGAIANTPEVALTELVANAWDAGSTKVEIVLPNEPGSLLTIRDDGTGMTALEFQQKWMTLGYDRVRNQGRLAEFPPGREGWKRPAYGRNGVGRHAMLCFASEYEVATKKGGVESTFAVETASGKDPFRIVRQDTRRVGGHGTQLRATVERNLPSPDHVATVLSARFLHDPQFTVSVNGQSIPLADHQGLVNEKILPFGNGCSAHAYFVDSTRAARTTQHQGVAFWVGGRLVGEPGWVAQGKVFMDGRTRIAKRYTVIVKSEDLFDDVSPDWTEFKKSERVEAFLNAVADYVQEVFLEISQERIQDTTASVLREHVSEIRDLRPSAKMEVVGFIESVTKSQPTIQPDSLSAAVRGVIDLEKTRTGAALLEKIARLSEEDVAGLDRLLGEWTVRDALTVLDELDRRLRTAEAVEKLSADKKVDELHALHPLVAESRWLFGLEFDTPEYVSNASLTKAMKEIFKKRLAGGEFANPRKRTDILVLGDATVSGVATEAFEESALPKMSNVLLLELKRGGAEISREHMNQAANYVQDFLGSGLMEGAPHFRVFVIGHTISEKVQRQFKIAERAEIEAATYGQLVRQANRRLFRLRDKLTSRYEEATGSELLDRILAEPEQERLKSLFQ
ncbi:MAG: ATP-binding protein [Terracidiphilus sp.]